jgi:hypothetical protein
MSSGRIMTAIPHIFIFIAIAAWAATLVGLIDRLVARRNG